MSVTAYEDDHEKEISQSDGMKKVIINEDPTRVNTVTSSKVRRDGFGSEKASTVSRARMTMRCGHHRCAREQRFHTEHDYWRIAGRHSSSHGSIRQQFHHGPCFLTTTRHAKSRDRDWTAFRDCSIWRVKQIRWTELERQEQDPSTETVQEFEFRARLEDQRNAQEARESELRAKGGWALDQDQIVQKHDERHRPSLNHERGSVVGVEIQQPEGMNDGMRSRPDSSGS